MEEDVRKEAAYKFSLDAKVTCLRYMRNRVYAGLKNGNLIVFSRDEGEPGRRRKRGGERGTAREIGG